MSTRRRNTEDTQQHDSLPATNVRAPKSEHRVPRPAPEPDKTTDEIIMVPVTSLRPHPAALKLPPLDESKYELLKASVEASGVIIPVIIDGRNNIIDGVHRWSEGYSQNRVNSLESTQRIGAPK